MQKTDLSRFIIERSQALGFIRIGFATAEPFQRGSQALKQWLKSQFNGSMDYMDCETDRATPKQLLDNAKTIIVVAMPYEKAQAQANPVPQQGYIAQYARGQDYHFVMQTKLKALANDIEKFVATHCQTRTCVDTTPILEREAAMRAGIAFIGKSNMAIVPGHGSYVLLGELLLDIALEPTQPLESRCGDCTACMDFCPTQAFVSPFVLDARRCISYLTIEQPGPIPLELRPKIGNMIFGCDRCQQVCPFNASPKPKPVAKELQAKEKLNAPNLVDLLHMGSAQFRQFVKHTAMRRIGRKQLMRNVAVALGNSGDQHAVPALLDALKNNRYPLVRGHVAWALGQLGGKSTPEALKNALKYESHQSVRDEIWAALAVCAQRSNNQPKFNPPNYRYAHPCG